MKWQEIPTRRTTARRRCGRPCRDVAGSGPEVEVPAPSHCVTRRALGSLVAMACIGLASCSGGPAGGHPDLVVAPPSVSDGGPSAGTRFTFSTTVRNAGRGTTAATTLRIYRSDDVTITRSDEEVGATTLAELAASASVVASVEVTAPSSAGTYYYGACMDPVAQESDTAHPCSAAAPVTVQDAQPRVQDGPQPATRAAPAPDLVVEAAAVDDTSPVTGARWRVSAVVRNVGDRPAAATWASFYRSTDSTITNSDEGLASVPVSEVAPSHSKYVWEHLTVHSQSGTYYYGACVRAVDEESDTTNNCSASVRVTVRQASRTDLEVLSPWVSPRDPAIGGTFRLHMTLRNAGERTDGFWIRFYRSDDATFTGSDPHVHGTRIRRMNSLSSTTISEYLDTPSTMGEHYYRACAEEVPGESDTTNNCSAPVKIEVSHDKPNLRIPQTGWGSPIGDSLLLDAGVENVGGPSAATTLRFYHSTDEEITPSDVEVGTVSVPELVKTRPHKPARFHSPWVYVPMPTTPGAHHYGVCVDPVPGESDTTDNCWSGGVIHTIRL